jgi:uncharacterized protein YidB (DUF937 family)
MAFWRKKKSDEKHADQHRIDPGIGDALGEGSRGMIKAVAEGVARGVTGAVLDRMDKPGMAERVKGWFR